MSLTSTSDWPKNLRWFCPCRIENTIMREFLFAFRFLLILFMIARVDAASAQSGQPAAAPLQSDLISSWLVTIAADPRQRRLIIRGVAAGTNGKFLLDTTYGQLDGKLSQVRGEITESGTERTLELVTPADSTIVAKQLTDGSFAGTLTSKNGVVKSVKLERLASGVIDARKDGEAESNVNQSPSSLVGQSTGKAPSTPGKLPSSVQQYSGRTYDGDWSGQGKAIGDSGNCSSSASIKFTVKGASIFSKGPSVWFQGRSGGSSKIIGVIHEDNSIDIALYETNDRGRTNVGRGKVTDKEIKISDLSMRCSYEYIMSR